MTIWKYGEYSHPEGEVKLSSYQITAEKTQRGERTGFWHRFQLMGDVIASSQDDFNTRIDKLEQVYSEDYQDCGLYYADGTATSHTIPNASSASGVHVDYFTWIDRDRAELATHRSFAIGISAFFENATSEIVSYFENIQFRGDGGRRWEWVRTPIGTIAKQKNIFLYTPQTIVQWGQIVARTLYPTGNVPPPVFPIEWEHADQRVVTAIGPQWIGNAHRNFGIAWRYVGEAPNAQQATPTLLYP